MHRLTGLAHLAFRRLLHDRLLYAVLLLGWIMVTALVTAIPSYVDAVHQQLLRKELQTEVNSRRPSFGFLFLSLDSVSSPTQLGGDGSRRSGYQVLAPYLKTGLPADLALPVVAQMHYVKSDLFQLFHLGTGTYGRSDEPLHIVNIGFISDIETEASVVEGRMPDGPSNSQGPIEVLVHSSLANRLGIQAGEEFVLYRAASPNPQTGERAIAIAIRITGIWEAKQPSSSFWYIAPSAFENTLLTTELNYLHSASGRIPRPFFELGWYSSLEGDSVRADKVPEFLHGMSKVKTQVQQRLPNTNLVLSPENALLRYQGHVARQSPILLVLGLPVLGLLFLFVIISARSLMARQQMEIATIRSRGGSGPLIMSTYALQGLLFSLVSLLVGIPGGILAAKFMGPAPQWLLDGSFELPGIQLTPILTQDSLLFAVVAVVLVNLATILPAMRYVKSTIITAERHLTRDSSQGLRGTLSLDILVGCAGIYGWYLLQTQGHFGQPTQFQSAELYENPLLFLTPCLWLWTGGRLAAFLFPWVCRWLDRPIQVLPGTSFLIAVRNLARQSVQHQSLLTLLLLTTGLGAFVTSVIHTMDDNLRDRALYETGSTIAVVERAKRFRPSLTDSVNPSGWAIPPFDAHSGVTGVLAAARVGRFPVNVSIGNRNYKANLYGIDRADWPHTGYFRTDFASRPLGALMNELALSANGLLVPAHLLDTTGLVVGDYLELKGLIVGGGESIPFQIVGTLKYFPTAFPPEDLFVVGNLDYIFNELGGDLPYHVWLKVADEVQGESVRKELEAQSIEVLRLEDARVLIEERRASPARQGMFGFLILGLAVTFLLSVLALAVHAVLTLQRRRIQLAILRALGWTRRQVGVSLIFEQSVIAVLGIGGGTVLGFGVSHLFVPFLKEGSTAAERIPPFLVRISWDEPLIASVILLTVVGMITVVLNAVLARTRLYEVLKLGEFHG